MKSNNYNKHWDNDLKEISKMEEAIDMEWTNMKDLVKRIKDSDMEENEEEVSKFFPPEFFKPFLEKLLERMSEDDAKTILTTIFNELSKKDGAIKLGASIETAIMSAMIDKV